MTLTWLEAQVVNDEYRGSTITYSKDSYNRQTVGVENLNNQQPKRYIKKSTKVKKVVNDEYRGDTIRYSSTTKMTRAEWENKHKKPKTVQTITGTNSTNSTKSIKRIKKVRSDEYQGSGIIYNR